MNDKQAKTIAFGTSGSETVEGDFDTGQWLCDTDAGLEARERARLDTVSGSGNVAQTEG